jgi:UDP-2,3-diacylglucosamine pyrophosphatase LpxH
MNAHLVFVSDLHLTPVGFGMAKDGGETGRAFCAFVNDVRSRMDADGDQRHLVLLGDSLELLHGMAPQIQRDAAARADAIARGHSELFRTLGAAARGGLALEFVCGNHDAQLAFRSVQERVVERLGTSDNVAFHPWIYHVPGVAYAEHGSQYHAPNAFGFPLPEAGDPDRLRHPVGAYVDLEVAALGAPDGGSTRAATLTASARAFRRYLADGIQRAPNRRRGSVEACARDEHLPPRAIQAILDAREPLSLQIAIRVAETIRDRAIGRARARSTYAPTYLHRSAARIDAILRASGAAVPFMVFGHSHVAERVRLRDGVSAATVLGTGTWTKEGPARAALPSRAGRFPFVEISGTPDGASANVATWEGAAMRKEVIA